MALSQIVAVLLLLAQILNAGAFFVDVYAPEYSVVIAGIVGAIQAFTSKVQGDPKRK